MIFELVIAKSWSFGKQAAVALLVNFHENNRVLNKYCCYGNIHWTTCPPSWPPSWNF